MAIMKNVLAVLDVIEASYGSLTLPKPTRPILIVDWGGYPLDPIAGRGAARAMVACARTRLRSPPNIRRPWLSE
jgi:hypothetical protein